MPSRGYRIVAAATGNAPGVCRPARGRPMRGSSRGRPASLHPPLARGHATCGHIGRSITAPALWSALQKGRQYGS
ncbi:hypothetical protein Xaut_4233 [Xanthobacter versatilis]|uniref:Uncharacterized protein n=1 Tax=Xanthobacter autotrophicus (strain ATCC BAA-1158 / Py2) TaxID=78245 RepID=A7IN61_XANP2|nr:hypothetical protein Xaut_4233 [Xanthobacter autotrophicus Py2]